MFATTSPKKVDLLIIGRIARTITEGNSDKNIVCVKVSVVQKIIVIMCNLVLNDNRGRI
jgi:hypothetical protein